MRLIKTERLIQSQISLHGFETKSNAISTFVPQLLSRTGAYETITFLLAEQKSLLNDMF